MIGVVVKEGLQYGVKIGGGDVEIHTPDTIGKVIVDFLLRQDKRDGKGRHLKSVLYVSDLSIIGTAILQALKDFGLKDLFRGGDSMIGEYAYLMDDKGEFFSIEVCSYVTRAHNFVYSLERVLASLDPHGMGCSALGETVTLCYDIIDGLCAMVDGECLTMSSFAYRLWTDKVDFYDRHETFPDARKVDVDLYGCTLDDCLRLAYKGGWCYMKASSETVYEDGITIDANSLYPYIMKSRRFPVGKPYIFVGYDLPDVWQERLSDGRCVGFVHFSCKWEIKKGYLPFLQIPHDFRRFGISSSSVVWDADHEYCRDESVDLWMTKEEFELFTEHYSIRDYAFYEWFIFGTQDIFSSYVDRFYRLKADARRRGDAIDAAIAKGMLNFLSGTFAKKAHRVNSYFADDEYTSLIQYETESGQKSLIYIGACITSWARVMMVRLAQKNYTRFLYCDTDSLHLIGKEPPVGCDIDGAELGKFKVEREWRAARFYKQKCYIEQREDGHYDLVYAGVPHDVQEQMEKKLSGWYSMGTIFTKGVPDWKFKDGSPMMKSIDMVTSYDMEVPNGTFTPDKVKRQWHIGMDEAKNRSGERWRKIRWMNKTLIEKLEIARKKGVGV